MVKPMPQIPAPIGYTPPVPRPQPQPQVEMNPLASGVSYLDDLAKRYIYDQVGPHGRDVIDKAMIVPQVFGMGADVVDAGQQAQAAKKAFTEQRYLDALAASGYSGLSAAGLSELSKFGGLLSAMIPTAVRPARESLHEVADASFPYNRVVGDDTVPLKDLKGGTSIGDDPKRIDKLAEAMSGPEGYIERLIVDQDGNVIEGAHRLEALRRIGDDLDEVPISRIEDLEEVYPVEDIEKAIREAGIVHGDAVHYMTKEVMDAIRRAGSPEAALKEFEFPPSHQPAFEAAIDAITKPKRRGTEQVLGRGRLQQAAAPALIPAIRHRGKVYKADTHLDALNKIEDPAERSKAMLDGDNRVFVNDKGRVLDRFKAAEYAKSFNLYAPDAPDWVKTHPEIISEFVQRVSRK